MFALSGKLSQKIIGMLVVFFLVATSAIGLTLVISWQLEGVAAAINDGGSQRMRTYRIGHLMARGLESQAPGEILMRSIEEEMKRFDKVLRDLQLGDPARPLAAPRNPDVQKRLWDVEQTWGEFIRPLVRDYLAGNAQQRAMALDSFDSELEPFVGRINDLGL